MPHHIDENPKSESAANLAVLILRGWCRSGAIFKVCGVKGFIPYTLMDFKHLTSANPAQVDSPLTYLVGKTVTVKLVQVRNCRRISVLGRGFS